MEPMAKEFRSCVTMEALSLSVSVHVVLAAGPTQAGLKSGQAEADRRGGRR